MAQPVLVLEDMCLNDTALRLDNGLQSVCNRLVIWHQQGLKNIPSRCSSSLP